MTGSRLRSWGGPPGRGAGQGRRGGRRGPARRLTLLIQVQGSDRVEPLAPSPGRGAALLEVRRAGGPEPIDLTAEDLEAAPGGGHHILIFIRQCVDERRDDVHV